MAVYTLTTMVLAKSKNSVGLGNSLMKDRFGKGKASSQKKVSHNAAIARTDQNGDTYVTNPQKEASWVKMRSVTEQGALDEFLSTAELAGTDFTAEKMSNVKIIHADQKNPFLLSASEEKSTMKKHQKNRNRLTVPRRPKWDKTTSPAQLEAMERESLLEWRRGLADLQENHDLLMTPFERNLEVWRQLWRVIERSDLVVQIVDARNPLLFRCEDLEIYVKQIDSKKKNLLLVNKADMLTEKQREMWADYFDRNNIPFRFFSAHLAKERNEARLLEEQSGSEDDADELANAAKDLDIKEEQKAESSEEDHKPRRTNILDVDELEELFLSNTPDTLPLNQEAGEQRKHKTVIGLVGYPNVGKSSTINSLLGSKKVSVSATPGKTKHFQTLYLSPEILLCDCPGLVFPNFATTKAELVVNGVLPIDQQREFTGPAALVTQRVPKHFLENVYGIKIHTRPLEEGGTGVPNAHELLRAYARARGFATTGQGQPDESRAARYVLKDYVAGKLLFCHPPTTADEIPALDPYEFNKELYDMTHLPARRQAALAKAAQQSDLSAAPTPSAEDSQDSASDENDDSDDAANEEGEHVHHVPSAKPNRSEEGARARTLDSGFFKAGAGASAGHMTMPFSHQYTEQGKQQKQKQQGQQQALAQGQGKQLTGRKERMMVALEDGVDEADVRAGSKKHFKGNKRRAKGKRVGDGADDY